LYKGASTFNFFFESYFDFILQSTGVFFYFIFMDRFMEAKKSFPFLHRLFRLGQAVIFISCIAFTIIYFFTNNYSLQMLVETYTKYEWIVTTGLFVIYATTRKNKMLNILAAGHLLILIFTFSSQILIQYPGVLSVPVPSIWRSSLFYYQLGMTFELILFLVALAFKNRHYMAERTREREKLLLENERKEFEKQLAVVEAKQQERNRISIDMHDELGSGVTAIRLMSEIVKTKMKGNTLPEIEKISTNANDLISKMNTIIWTMTSSNDKLDSMIAYLRSYAIEFFESTSINCHFKSTENIPPEEMSGEKRRNIFLSVKETLNNVAKHSKATEVSIDITIIHNLMKISVHDNGIGINFHKLREFGNGLNNIKKRMEGVEGAFTIENNGGTTTILTIPL
jgi:signal transduction histidine kinase